MLYREPKLLKANERRCTTGQRQVSVLYREPKLLKDNSLNPHTALMWVSVLYREPKLLKAKQLGVWGATGVSFSALP